MATKTGKLLITSASLLGVAALLAACSSGSSPDGSGGAGGADGSGGTSTGGTSTGGAGTGGAGSGGCPSGAPDYVIWHPDGGAGGVGGVGGASDGMSFLCYPGIVCISADVPSPEFYPAMFAYTHVGASAAGSPVSFETNGAANVVITKPEPGRVCTKGDAGAPLSFQLGDPEFWDGEGDPLPAGVAPVPWDDLAITQMRFTLETPPSAGITLSYLTISACGEPSFLEAEVDGNPLILNQDGETTTLSLEATFGSEFELMSGAVFDFAVGPGEFDFCIKDLEFLNADGEPVE